MDELEPQAVGADDGFVDDRSAGCGSTATKPTLVLSGTCETQELCPQNACN